MPSMETILKPSSLLLNTLTIFFCILQATSDTSLDNFLQCLLNHSQPTNPITEVIYTPINSSFSSLLITHISNRRYSTPSTPKPLAIVAAKHESHVQATIICAKSYGLQVRIRSGGHDYEGLSYVSNVPFVILDMVNLASIDIDVAKETAWVQAGATIGELYYSIFQKSNVLGFPAGVSPTLGTGGHFSGGGYGNMMRKYGLSVDNIIDAQLIDANGRIHDRKSMGEDVFWAICGGGGASFGVILSWKIKLVPVPPQVSIFKVTKTIEEGARDVVYQWQLVATKLPEDLYIRVMHEVVNATQEGKKIIQVSFIGQFLGQTVSLLPLVNENFPELGLQKSDCIEMPWINSTLFWAEYPIGTPIDVLLAKHKAPQLFFKSRSDYVKKPIPKTVIENIWDLIVKGEKVYMQWNPYGGKMHEISASATPFPHRAGNLFLIQYYTFWTEEGIDATNHYMNFSRSFYEFMTPYVSSSPREAFLCYRDLDVGANPSNRTNEDIARIYGSKYYLDNFQRLVRAKAKIDPENFFKHEQSIPPR
ncbi:hypothetical protein L6164_000112 [Bauhinia variegata]|uniref:Uncharacterized protein n=1 Tax=Bauhinia variegata TaxID=167791 RepID=A0ACB9QB34_BAUVA|nr:hypothetical protein L6164_000112 [Bauhinia variegata]